MNKKKALVKCSMVQNHIFLVKKKYKLMLKARALNAMKLFTRGVASNFHLKFEDFLCLLKKVHYSDTFAAISAGIFRLFC